MRRIKPVATDLQSALAAQRRAFLAEPRPSLEVRLHRIDRAAFGAA